MSISVGVGDETNHIERRVALTPGLLPRLQQHALGLRLQAGAGKAASFFDENYEGVTLCADLADCYSEANIIFRLTPPTPKEIALMPEGSVVVGQLSPYGNKELLQAFAKQRVTAFALELLPRISRAQAMDVLSSQASIAGYKAVLLAANTVGSYFPMLTTAASTIYPLKVLVIGAGVAGLQAMATAKRLGAIVTGYDVRPETNEQIESLGAKALELLVSAKSEGGYARELSEQEKAQQQAELENCFKEFEVIITTAAVPGRPAPKIITEHAVESMQPGTVIVDVAAITGGNCELTKPDETVCVYGVTILGPTNLASSLARDASFLFGNNLLNFMQLLLNDDAQIHFDWDDEIIKKTVLAHAGEIRRSDV